MQKYGEMVYSAIEDNAKRKEKELNRLLKNVSSILAREGRPYCEMKIADLFSYDLKIEDLTAIEKECELKYAYDKNTGVLIFFMPEVTDDEVKKYTEEVKKCAEERELDKQEQEKKTTRSKVAMLLLECIGLIAVAIVVRYVDVSESVKSVILIFGVLTILIFDFMIEHL